jgi:CRP-like cAMP-binding protein
MEEDIKIIDSFFANYEPKLTKKTILILRSYMKVCRLPKKHIIIKENQTISVAYLIVSGAARSFHLQNGVEVNTRFAFENEVVGSLRKFSNMPSRQTFELIEDSILIAFDMSEIKPLMKKHVEISNFVNLGILEYALYIEDKLYHTHLRSAEERFTALLSQQPQVFQRVPLTYIASFLGITRETLSRLRAK